MSIELWHRLQGIAERVAKLEERPIAVGSEKLAELEARVRKLEEKPAKRGPGRPRKNG